MSAKTRPCIVCKQPIDPERIEVLPETVLCTEHAQQIRKFGGEFVVSSRRVNTSKAGSLKKNYGDVDVSQTRNEEALRKLMDEYELSRQPS